MTRTHTAPFGRVCTNDWAKFLTAVASEITFEPRGDRRNKDCENPNEFTGSKRICGMSLVECVLICWPEGPSGSGALETHRRDSLKPFLLQKDLVNRIEDQQEEHIIN